MSEQEPACADGFIIRVRSDGHETLTDRHFEFRRFQAVA